MYIVLLLSSFFYSLFAYFQLLKRKKSFNGNEIKYVLSIISIIVLLVLLIDLPFYVGIDRETFVEVNHIKVYSSGKRNSLDLVTLYMDTNRNVYWSGAPIGHEEWIEFGGSSNTSRICTIKYLPLTKIVVTVTEGGEVVYNNIKDILSMSLTAFFYCDNNAIKLYKRQYIR